MKLSILGIITLTLTTLLFGCVAKTKDTLVFHGSSMEPNIHDGDRLTVERFPGGGKVDVKRRDIIALKYPDDPSKFYIKRLIGLPNDTIEMREGEVFINGSKLEEPYVEPKRNQSRIPSTPVVVKEHHYYVLGDNRDASSDSRSWGLVPEENIFAKVIPQ
jgi:signal peptidase I